MDGPVEKLVNPLIPIMKPWVIESFLTFGYMDSVTIQWIAADQYCAVVFVLQFHLACNFGKFINFGLCTFRSERVKLMYMIYI